MLTALGSALAVAGGVIVLRENWPPYYYDVRLPSPDGRYTVFILRGDKAAFDDFSYRVYVVPHGLAPAVARAGDRAQIKGIWRNKRYLIYSGYATPALRWTSSHEIEIDLNDLYDEVDEFHPVPKLEKPLRDSSAAILVSLILNKHDGRNTTP